MRDLDLHEGKVCAGILCPLFIVKANDDLPKKRVFNAVSEPILDTHTHSYTEIPI